MDCISASPIHEPLDRAPLPATRLRCPLCNGPLLDGRGMFRCGRCGFSFCAGCDGADAESVADGES